MRISPFLSSENIADRALLRVDSWAAQGTFQRGELFCGWYRVFICQLRPRAQGLADRVPGVLQFLPNHFQSRRADASVSHPYLRLDELDQLDKIRRRIHAQQGQEP